MRTELAGNRGFLRGARSGAHATLPVQPSRNIYNCGQEATPPVVDGVIYTTGARSKVQAFDVNGIMSAQ